VEEYTDAHFTFDNGDELSRDVGRVSLILVLLTALNVAALMVARGVSRARETAIRAAIGASRFQIMALTLTESLALAIGGGVLGLLFGQAALSAMTRYLWNQATIVPYWMDFSLGRESVLLVGLLVILALAVSGILPALRTSRTDLDHALRTRPHDAPGSRVRVMGWIVGLEVTLSCFLLALAAVAVEEAQEQLRTGAEFPTEGVLTGQVVLESLDYPDRASREVFFASLLNALRAEPLVESATLSTALPGKPGAVLPVGLANHGEGTSPHPPAQVRSIDPEFLDLLQLPVLVGRRFAGSDDESGDPVAIVNEAFVRRHGIEGNALGRSIAVDRLVREEPYTATIVGVVGDRGVTPHARGQPVAGVYLPFQQVSARAGYLLVRTRTDASLPEVWHDAVGALNPYLPLGEVLSLEETLRRGHGTPTLFGSVFLALGASTLLVALVGLYGVHSFSLSRRVREIGLRRALGAREEQIAWESVRRGLHPVWVGVLLGTVPGVLVAGLLAPVEPSVLGILAAPLLLVATSLLALWRPTWAASRAHPMDALREG
jgi:predicted permease